MSDPWTAYLRKIEAARRLGNDTEHTHRPALQALLESLNPSVAVTNEPKRIQCGAPDLVITRKQDALVLGHVEAKDVGVSLDEAAKSEQVRKRYLPALPNFLLTDYLEFRWFVDGQLRDHFRLAESKPNGALAPDPAALPHAERHPQGIPWPRTPPHRTRGGTRPPPGPPHPPDPRFHRPRLPDRQRLRTPHRLALGLRPDPVARTGRAGQGSRVRRHVRADAGLWPLLRPRPVAASAAASPSADAAKLIPKTNPFLRDFFDLITGAKAGDETVRWLCAGRRHAARLRQHGRHPGGLRQRHRRGPAA